MMSCNNKEKTYWEGMDETANIWAASIFGAVTAYAIGAAEQQENGDEEKPEASAANEKPSVVKRMSTASTVLDSEHFGSNEEEQGWEVKTTNTTTCFERYTRHPHFCKRFSICSGISILLIVMIAVLCATLTGEPVTTAASGASAGAGVGTGTGTDKNLTGGNVPSAPPPPGDTSTPDNLSASSSTFDLTKHASPFSKLDPVQDLGVMGVVHSRVPPQPLSRASQNKAVPTNAWYENLIVGAKEEPPTNIHKAYAVPYLVDVVGPLPGLRVHPNHLDTQATLVQLLVVESHGLTLGASGSTEMAYNIASTNPLGVTLEWNTLGMTSTITRGMPYSTMHYPKPLSADMLPTVAAEVALEGNPIRDDNITMECSPEPTRVERELKLTFSSDYTWMVFFSEPVMVQCIDLGSSVQWQVVKLADDNAALDQLTIRAALLTSCTNGNNAIYCNEDNQDPTVTAEYEDLLRERAPLFPGPNADVRYGVDTKSAKATVRLDWDVQDMKKSKSGTADNELFMYALPHHLTRMEGDKWMPWSANFCHTSLIGSTCAVTGSTWDLEENLPIASFRSPRPPLVEALPAIAQALRKDISYQIPENFQRGAGDTYFSGKVLARLGRVLLIHEELEDLCNGIARGYDLTDEEKLAYMNACVDITLPSDDEINKAVDMLRSSVEVWINGTAEAQFAYDSGWGGVINCGCIWNGAGCDDNLDDCPATREQGLNFGNGFYNDHHFHYGYHVYAAAALTHFDRAWGRQHFEDVLLLVRDYANPSEDDVFFPRFRNKDWYQGSSWASGITNPTFGNIVNQESTSEAIAGYEAVALFGKEMMLAWDEVNKPKMVKISREIRDVGLVTAATEIRSTDFYWHVLRENDPREIYPSGYQHGVVGILWATMAQFTTWFGNAPYLIYGIQLLPLTPIAENRDANQAWLREMYQPLAQSCAADAGCTLQGWSVLQLAIMASIGNVDTAMQLAQEIPDVAFDSAGGNGHSMTNSLHYFATRPEVAEPMDLPDIFVVDPPNEDDSPSFDCGSPQTCTPDILATMAAGYTCEERISWLMNWQGMDMAGACDRVGRAEFPTECGGCVVPETAVAAATNGSA